jgi:hypothetical protein
MNKEDIVKTMTIDLTPDADQYVRLLNLVVAQSTNDDDRAWAEAELERLGVLA